MMFNLLFSQSFAAEIRRVEPRDPNKAAFDFKYVDSRYEEHSITTNSEGYYVAFRPYNRNGTPKDIEFLTYNREIGDWDTYSVSSSFSPGNNGAYYVEFHVYNFLHSPLTFDLGVFADVNFINDDNATLSLSKHNRAILCQTNNAFHQLILKGTDKPDVDTMFLGNYPNSQQIDPKFYPYWKNETAPTTSSMDSAYAFSWQNRTVPAQGYAAYAFYIAATDHFTNKPFLHDLTEKRKQYPKNFTLKLQVSDYDDDTVDVEFNFNWDRQEKITFTTDGKDNISQIFEFNLSFGDMQSFHYSVKATDSEGYYEELENTIWIEGSDVPILELYEDGTPLKQYLPTGKIRLSGQVDDEKYVDLFYQFDDAEINKYSQFDTSPQGKQEFQTAIDIPSFVTPGENHIFRVWVVDELKLESEKQEFEFFLVMPTNPIIYSAYTSDERVKVDDEIVLYGEASDPDDKQIVNVWATFEEMDGRVIGNFTSNRLVYPWAFFYTVPKVKKGKYTIKMHVVDATHQKSSNVSRVPIRVYDPDDPDPPLPPAKIIDVSSTTIKPGSNAAFNLQYQDEENITRSMSFKDEGFFSAFRLYDESFGLIPEKEIHLLKYTDGQKATARNVTVQFSTKLDEHTKYMHLVWEVTNDGYFNQYMDLGMFVDSDLAGDDNSGLWYRRDGRGFIVTSHDPVIHYTILTHGMYPYPDVSYTYLKDVPRNGDQPIPVDKMPFFQKGDGSAYKGNNSMYSLSWKRRTLLPGVTQTYGVVIAPHYDLKTPTRIIDNTKKYSWIEPNTEITLNFSFLDSDEGEQISYIVSVNGSEEDHTFNATKEGHSYTKTVNVGNGPYFYYEVQAEDTEIFFPSNNIHVQIPISRPPRLTLNKQYLKDKYFTDSKIRLAGTVSDEKSVWIMYSIGGGKALQAAYVDIEHTDRFDTEVPIPSAIKPGDTDWTLRVWAEDNWGIRMLEEAVTKSFRLSERNPPNLTKAGLSTRVARKGEQVLGYAIIDDKEVGKVLRLDIKFGNDEYIEVYRKQKFVGGRKPIAFFFKIPSTMNVGAYHLTFRLRDEDDLDSTYTSKYSLIVTDI